MFSSRRNYNPHFVESSSPKIVSDRDLATPAAQLGFLKRVKSTQPPLYNDFVPFSSFDK